MTANKAKLVFSKIVAMGVGGMVGGGIFSMLGLAISEAGHAAPIRNYNLSIVSTKSSFCRPVTPI